jgi:hypothetical protein
MWSLVFVTGDWLSCSNDRGLMTKDYYDFLISTYAPVGPGTAP